MVYKNNAVPWRYPVGETMTPSAINDNPIPEVTNIARNEGNKDSVHAKKDKAPEAPKRIMTEVLNDAHVAQDITLKNLKASSTTLQQAITSPFPKTRSQLRVGATINLFTSLSNNDFSLNVMPKATLDKLYSTDSTLKISSVVVRAFDGSKREVMGEITLSIHIGPTTFDITFQVMDIRLAYNCLLGKPWIHVVGAVPSFLQYDSTSCTL
ncbi:hypothetical protein CR513_07143, partial [Mucuna pruriens]